MLIGNLAVGKDFPMRVLAEIVDAALMDKETIQQTAKRFVEAGADILMLVWLQVNPNQKKLNASLSGLSRLWMCP